MHEVFEVINKGLFKIKGAPLYGRQDIGYSPGGALDQFSTATGNILLGNEPSAEALEVVLPPSLRVKKGCYFILTGGGLGDATLEHPGFREVIRHARVYFADAGSVISFGRRVYGFRTYICYRVMTENEESIAGRTRGDFQKLFRWPDPENRIRLMKGPEYRYLEEPEKFLQSRWQVSDDISDMALKLTRLEEPPRVSLKNMVSAPVNDGTVQLTPGGPILLLRQRQTVGGYPRVFNVISADVDLLAQYGPFQALRFRLVSPEEALSIAKVKRADLDKLESRYQ